MILSVCYLCLSVSQNSTGGVGVDSNVTVCVCVSQNSTGHSGSARFPRGGGPVTDVDS